MNIIKHLVVFSMGFMSLTLQAGVDPTEAIALPAVCRPDTRKLCPEKAGTALMACMVPQVNKFESSECRALFEKNLVDWKVYNLLNDPKAYSPRIPVACKDETVKFCGKAETIADAVCLAGNSAKLSSECSTAVNANNLTKYWDAMAKELSLFKNPPAGFEVPRVCNEDVQKGQCKKKRGADLVSCLLDQRDTVSADCRTAVDYMAASWQGTLETHGWYQIPELCNRDRAKLCPGLQTNQAIAACLLEKKDDVKNTKCTAVLDYAKVNWDILLLCESSIKELCPNSAASGAQATNCIMSMQDGVNDTACTAAIQKLKDIQQAAASEKIKCQLSNVNNCKVETIKLTNFNNGVSITIPAK